MLMTQRPSLEAAILPTIEELINFFQEKFGPEALKMADFKVVGALCRAMARRYGDAGLQAIEEFFTRQGKKNGQFFRSQLPNTEMKTIQEFFGQAAERGEIEGLRVERCLEDRFHLLVDRCLFGFEEGMLDQRLCHHIMAIDREMFKELSGGKLRFETIKGPPSCVNIVRTE